MCVANYGIHDPVADTGGGGGKPGLCPPPPLTNKDTPPVHCNEFSYTCHQRRTVVARAGLDLLYVLNITPDTWPFFNCAFVSTLRISIAVRKVVDLRSPPSSDPMAKRQLTIAEVFAASKKCMCQ